MLLIPYKISTTQDCSSISLFGYFTDVKSLFFLFGFFVWRALLRICFFMQIGPISIVPPYSSTSFVSGQRTVWRIHRCEPALLCTMMKGAEMMSISHLIGFCSTDALPKPETLTLHFFLLFPSQREREVLILSGIHCIWIFLAIGFGWKNSRTW